MGAETAFDALMADGNFVGPTQGFFDADIAIHDRKIQAFVLLGTGVSADSRSGF